jgi:hypothetical protein
MKIEKNNTSHDGDQECADKGIQNDGISIIPQGPITRLRTNKLRHSMISYIQEYKDKWNFDVLRHDKDDEQVAKNLFYIENLMENNYGSLEAKFTTTGIGN